MHPKKGLDTLIKAWSRIESIFKDWELKIVGPDEVGHKRLELLVRKTNLQRVFFEPAVYGLEKDILLSKCDLLFYHQEAKTCFDGCRESCSRSACNCN